MSIRALIVAVLVFLAAGLHAAPPAAVMRAIRQVEGVKHPARRGPAGELGYYRVTAGVWYQHTRQPFARCGTSPGLEQAVVEKHLAWLTTQLQRRGIRATPYRLAYAWNAGLEAACFRIPTDLSATDYAQRVENLCSQ